jgi:NAD(P)-dependent dehydrogenase (short-subunit alcohol dehydrogenase family)
MATLAKGSHVPNRHDQKVALITGAAGNIGSATAHRLLLEGARLALVDLDAEILEEMEKNLVAAYPQIESTAEQYILRVVADVTEEEDMKAAVRATVERFSRLDIAFLCAGMSYTSTPVFDTDIELYDRITRTNCRSGQSTGHFLDHGYHHHDPPRKPRLADFEINSISRCQACCGGHAGSQRRR